MGLTLILSLAVCALLLLTIWIATVTMPFRALAGFFPQDVQERLKPRLDAQKMTGKRIAGMVLTVLLLLGYVLLFVTGGIDGLHHGFRFGQFFLRFFIMTAIIKLFDIVCLDYILLTKTQFFQHYLPETAGCAGWKQFGYNRKQQLRQCISLPVFSLIGALIFSRL